VLTVPARGGEVRGWLSPPPLFQGERFVMARAIPVPPEKREPQSAPGWGFLLFVNPIAIAPGLV
jgi:hypothetical protein